MHWLCLFLCLKVRTICATHCDNNGEIRTFSAMAECTVIVSKVFAKNCGQAHDRIPNIFSYICFRFSRERVQKNGSCPLIPRFQKIHLQRIEFFSQNLTKIVPKTSEISLQIRTFLLKSRDRQYKREKTHCCCCNVLHTFPSTFSTEKNEVGTYFQIISLWIWLFVVLSAPKRKRKINRAC